MEQSVVTEIDAYLLIDPICPVCGKRPNYLTWHRQRGASHDPIKEVRFSCAHDGTCGHIVAAHWVNNGIIDDDALLKRLATVKWNETFKKGFGETPATSDISVTQKILSTSRIRRSLICCGMFGMVGTFSITLFKTLPAPLAVISLALLFFAIMVISVYGLFQLVELEKKIDG